MISYESRSYNYIQIIYLLFICKFKENYKEIYFKKFNIILDNYCQNNNIDLLKKNINNIESAAIDASYYILQMYSLFNIATLMLNYNNKKEKLYYLKSNEYENHDIIIIFNSLFEYNNLNKEFNKKLNFELNDQIKKKAEYIYYNGATYKLDSCLIINKNITHQIAGIHINNVPVIYDSMSYNQSLKLPCNLFKFDWKSNLNK